MTQKEKYESAKQLYATIGVDTDAAITKLKEVPVSLHCWQGDDVVGFDKIRQNAEDALFIIYAGHITGWFSQQK